MNLLFLAAVLLVASFVPPAVRGQGIVSADATNSISLSTGTFNDLCVSDSGAGRCGTIAAGIGRSGRVGIKNRNPLVELDVTGEIRASTVTTGSIAIGSFTATGAATFESSVTVNGTALFKSTLSVSGDFSVGGGTTIITLGGNTGFGDATPTEARVVARLSGNSGNTFTTVDAAGDTALELRVDGPNEAAINVGTADSLAFKVDGTTRAYIAQGGGFGVGTVAPGSTLHVAGTGLFTSTLSVSGDFSVGGSTTLVTVGGRVGIGIAAPLTTLDVTGAATVRGAATVSGSSLTATAGIGGHSVAGGLGLIGTVTSESSATLKAGLGGIAANGGLGFIGTITHESSATFKALVGGIVANGGLGVNTALTVATGGASSTTIVGTSDTSSLELYSRGGSGEDWAFASNTSGQLNFFNRTDSASRLLMDAGGNIGIRTTSPCSTCTLHVPQNVSFGYTESSSMTVIGQLTVISSVSIQGAASIGGGSTIARITKTATASTDLGGAITPTNCTAETNFSVTGVAVGDACIVTTPAALASTDWIECRTLTDNVALRYCSGGSVDPAAMVYHITTIEY